jgi:hypothetical protein
VRVSDGGRRYERFGRGGGTGEERVVVLGRERVDDLGDEW